LEPLESLPHTNSHRNGDVDGSHVIRADTQTGTSNCVREELSAQRWCVLWLARSRSRRLL